jgi:hypothetical protein
MLIGKTRENILKVVLRRVFGQLNPFESRARKMNNES